MTLHGDTAYVRHLAGRPAFAGARTMSHPTTIRHALWDALRTFYRDFRRTVASASEHGGAALVVDASLPAVEAALGRQYFAPNWEFSYHERGEQLNLARVGYDNRRVRGHDYRWWQTHVRGWEQADDSLRLRPHYELEPTEYDQDHINGIGLDVNIGIDNVAAALDAEGLAYERYENLPPGGHSSGDHDGHDHGDHDGHDHGGG